jgi:hypothetical protein
MGGRLQNLAADLGQYLLPAVKRMSGELSDALKGIEAFVRDNEEAFTAWGASLEGAIGAGVSAWKHWREALEVAKEFAKEKAQNILEAFQWLDSNMPAVMDRVRDAIVDGFEAGMDLAQKVVEKKGKAIARTMLKYSSPAAYLAVSLIEGTGIGGVDAPRGKPRPFTPMNLSSSPGLAAALSNFGNLHQKDEALRNAKSIDEIVAEGMKARAPRAPKLSELRGIRGPDPSGKAGYDFALSAEARRRLNPLAPTALPTDAERPTRTQAEQARGLGSAVDAEMARQKAQDWRRAHPYAKGPAPGEAMANALRNPPGGVDDPRNKKAGIAGGVTDVDSYARELTEGGLKAAEKIAGDQLSEAKAANSKLDQIVKNTAAAKGGGSSWQ